MQFQSLECFPPKVNGEGHIKEWGRNTFAFGEKVHVVCGHLHSAVGPTEATCGESGFDVTEFTCVDGEQFSLLFGLSVGMFFNKDTQGTKVVEIKQVQPTSCS